MPLPLLEQPPLQDAQGRNVLGGPDVKAGQICITPMEQTGIAYLDNFCVTLPWNKETAGGAGAGQRQQQQHGLSVKRESSSAGWGGGLRDGSSGVRGDSRGVPWELVLLVQLRKRDSQHPGRWDPYRMPHLVSRPFQVVPRGALPVPMPSMLPASLFHQQRIRQQVLVQQQQKQQQERPQQQQQLQLEQRQQLPLQQQQRQQQLSLEQHQQLSLHQQQKLHIQQQRASASESPRKFLERQGSGFAAGSPTSSRQQLQGAAGVGGDFSPGLLVGGSAFGTAPNGGPELGPSPIYNPQERRKSCGSGLTPKRSARPRRRSCLSKDSASHDGALGSPLAPGTTTVIGGASRTVTPSGLAAMASAGAGASDAAGPLPPPLHLSGSARAMAPSVVLGLSMSGAADAGGNRLGLQQAPSATLLDTGLQELLDELEANPLGAEDLAELEGPPKRSKPSLTASEVAAFISDSSNSSLGPNQNVQQQMEAYIASRGSNRSSISHGSRQYGSYSSGSAAHSTELPPVRTQMARFSNTSFGSRDNDPASPLDALMHQLQQPGAIQDALDRMALEQGSYGEGQRRSSGFDGMQG